MTSETTTSELLAGHREEIEDLARRHRARSIKVFGSVARGEETPASDIDFVVEWRDDASLRDWAALQQDLEVLLNRRVDVVGADSLHWYIRDKVLNEARPLP